MAAQVVNPLLHAESDAWSFSTQRSSDHREAQSYTTMHVDNLSPRQKGATAFQCKPSICEKLPHTLVLIYSIDENDNWSDPAMPSTAHSSQPFLAGEHNTSEAMPDVEGQKEKALKIQEWTPTKHEWLVMISLAFISLMVALDATILVTVLPVSQRELSEHTQY